MSAIDVLIAERDKAQAIVKVLNDAIAALSGGTPDQASPAPTKRPRAKAAKAAPVTKVAKAKPAAKKSGGARKARVSIETVKGIVSSVLSNGPATAREIEAADDSLNYIGVIRALKAMEAEGSIVQVSEGKRNQRFALADGASTEQPVADEPSESVGDEGAIENVAIEAASIDPSLDDDEDESDIEEAGNPDGESDGEDVEAEEAPTFEPTGEPVEVTFE